MEQDEKNQSKNPTLVFSPSPAARPPRWKSFGRHWGSARRSSAATNSSAHLQRKGYRGMPTDGRSVGPRAMLRYSCPASPVRSFFLKPCRARIQGTGSHLRRPLYRVRDETRHDTASCVNRLPRHAARKRPREAMQKHTGVGARTTQAARLLGILHPSSIHRCGNSL